MAVDIDLMVATRARRGLPLHVVDRAALEDIARIVTSAVARDDARDIRRRSA